MKGRYHLLPRRLEDDYLVDHSKCLGTGYNGSVLPATSVRTGVSFAVKSFKLRGLGAAKLEELAGEVEILLSMDHPHVVRLMDVYQSDQEVSFVMETLEGGELFERARELGRFPEAEAAGAMLHMLRAVDYLHSEDVVHRDLKLENFMYDQKITEGTEGFLKLIDFGFSKFLKQGQTMKESLGSVMYVAPEVLSKNYSGGSCDMWSLGVIVFALLSGYMPFARRTQHSCLRSIKKGKYHMQKEIWSKISEHAQDFVKSLLVLEPELRLTAQQALAHPWLAGRAATGSAAMNRYIVDAFTSFSRSSRLKQSCMRMMAWTLPLDERRKLRDMFLDSGLTKRGVMQLNDIKLALQNESTLLAAEIKLVMQTLHNLDSDGDGDLHYSEFLAAMLAAQPSTYDATLHRTFWHFAKDPSGVITPGGMKLMFGKDVPEKEVDLFFMKADVDKDGKIDATEFVSCLAEGPTEDLMINVLRESSRRSKHMTERRSDTMSKCWACVGAIGSRLPLVGRCFGKRPSSAPSGLQS